MILLHLLNKPETRKYIRLGSELLSLLAPITDIHYQHSVDNWEDAKKLHFLSSLHNTRDDDFKLKVESSCIVLKTTLSSWSGVMLMASRESHVVQSSLSAVIEVLPLIGISAQIEVIEMLYGVFQLRVPTWTQSFTDALASIDTKRPLQEWTLSEGFVAEEAYSLLPPTTTGRPNIVKCHLSLLLSLMMDLGLFTSIAHICLGENGYLATRAAILLGELSHLANKLLPGMNRQSVQSMPEIVTAAMDFGDRQRRDRANAVISCLDNLHKMKKKGKRPSSLYLSQIANQGTHPKQAMNSISRDVDEASLSALIRSTLVTTNKDYKQWDWELLQSMLRVEPYCYRKVEENLKVKFFKRLHEFYKPDSKQFSSISYTPDASWKYSGVGCLLIRFFAKDEELIAFLPGIITDIVGELEEIASGRLSAHFSPYNLEHTLCRDYFLFLGCVSRHKPSVLSHCKAYGVLFNICEIDMRTDLHKLILSSLDFSRDRSSRAILSKMLMVGSAQTRLYATKMLRVLLRSRAQVFKSWGIEMLTTQLYDPDEEIATEALDILDEACEEESYLISLIQFNPALLHLSKRGVAFFTRFFSTRKGLSRMKQLGYLETELSRWHTEYNKVYVKVVEERLTQAFTSYRKVKDEEFIKRNIAGDSSRHPALVPVHLYSQLACHDDGCDVLDRTGYISLYSTVIRNNIVTCTDVHEVKATVWALAHIGTSIGGLELLMDEAIVHDLVRMAEANEVLTVRGTCFYALCLLARTVQGADVLQELGWVSLRHILNSSLSTTSTFTSEMTTPSPMLTVNKLENLFSPPDTSTSSENDSQPIEPPHISDKLLSSRVLLSSTSSSNKRRLSLSFTSRHGKEGALDEGSLLAKGQSGSASNIRDASSDEVVLVHQSRKEVERMPSPLQLSTTSATVNPYVTLTRTGGKKLLRLSSSRHDSISTIGSSAPISFYRPNYIGICLPKNQLNILQIPKGEFEGSQSGFVPPEVDDPSQEGLKHVPSRCLECRWILNDGLHPPTSSSSVGGVCPSDDERLSVRKETLRIVMKLSSDVASSANKQGLKL
jgi:rapamycin-insensitive companion of mTOR